MTEFKHFRLEEFACACCGKNLIDTRFVGRLDGLREWLGAPIFINSGYRCPKHNMEVSNTGENGPHTTGLAADVRVRSPVEFYDLVAFAYDLEFRGIGIKMHGPFAGRYVHLDVINDGNIRPRIWNYP